MNGFGNVNLDSQNVQIALKEIKVYLHQLGILESLQRFSINGKSVLHDSHMISISDRIEVYMPAMGGGPSKSFDPHPGSKCQKCAICSKSAPRFIHLNQRSHLPNLVDRFKIEYPNITDNSCICKCCDF